jgi:hypothetical protein
MPTMPSTQTGIADQSGRCMTAASLPRRAQASRPEQTWENIPEKCVDGAQLLSAPHQKLKGSD